MQNRNNGAHTVLLVEDDPRHRELVKKILQPQGYTVVQAADFKQAMATFGRYVGDISLLITEVSLADGNGCDLAIKLQERKRDLRFLFVSGSVGSEYFRYYGLGVADLHFLPKPFRDAELILRVRQVLDAGPIEIKHASPPRSFSASGTTTP